MVFTKQCECCGTEILCPQKAKQVKSGTNHLYFCAQCSILILPEVTLKSVLSNFGDPLDDIMRKVHKIAEK